MLIKKLHGVSERVKQRHLRWARLELEGKTASEIAKQFNVGYQTVHIALKKPAVKVFQQLVGQLNAIESGPSVAARRDMLWRIAKREEDNNPRVAISAVDILNKQEGLYRPDIDADGTGPLQVTVNNFTMNVSEKLLQDKNKLVTEREIGPAFKPLVVSTKSA